MKPVQHMRLSARMTSSRTGFVQPHKFLGWYSQWRDLKPSLRAPALACAKGEAIPSYETWCNTWDCFVQPHKFLGWYSQWRDRKPSLRAPALACGKGEAIPSYETWCNTWDCPPGWFWSDGLRAAAQIPRLVLAMTWPKTVIASTRAGMRKGRGNLILWNLVQQIEIASCSRTNPYAGTRNDVYKSKLLNYLPFH